MRQPRRAPATDTRQRLLAAAAEVFHERGYHGATLDEIAGRIGLLKGSLFHYIDSKQDLLEQVLEETGEGLHHEVIDILEGDGPPDVRVREAVLAYIRVFNREAPAYQIFADVLLRRTIPVTEAMQAALAARQRRHQDAWTRAIRAGMEAGTFRPDSDPALTFFAIMGMVTWMDRWYPAGSPRTLDEVGAAFSTLVLRGLGAPVHNSGQAAERPSTGD